VSCGVVWYILDYSAWPVSPSIDPSYWLSTRRFNGSNRVVVGGAWYSWNRIGEGIVLRCAHPEPVFDVVLIQKYDRGGSVWKVRGASKGHAGLFASTSVLSFQIASSLALVRARSLCFALSWWSAPSLSLSSSLSVCISSVPVTHYLPRSLSLTHTRSLPMPPPSLPSFLPPSLPALFLSPFIYCLLSFAPSLTHSLSHILCHTHTLSPSLFFARALACSLSLSLSLSRYLCLRTRTVTHIHSLVHQIISWMEASDEIPLEVLVEAFRQQAEYEVCMLVCVHIDI